MRRLALGGAISALLLVGGCSTNIGPTEAELKARWEAQNIYPDSYKKDLLAFLRTYLNDPSHVRSATVSQPQRKTVGAGERYVTCLRYDARNSDGKYMGMKGGYATYVDGKLDRFFDVPKEVAEFCKEMAFVPFPELEKLSR